MSPARPGRPRGPRADVADTRAALLRAAVALFAERGYDRTSLRDVAAAADLDVALVAYHFGGKDGLFAAAMELAVNPAELLEGVLEQGVDGLGERLVRTLLGVWDDPARGGPFIAVVRSAAANERAAELLRGFVEREILGRIATSIGARDGALRAALAGSQVVGLVMARHVVRLEPLASAEPDALVAAVGPTLQRYLTGEL
jgi:AcrR family transcriptional regulator